MITFSDVSKHFGEKIAVNHLSFEVQPSEVLALLGPNGAGKSTSMKMLTGYLPVTSGNISVCGFSMQSQTGPAQSHIGYLPEGTPLYTEATVSEFLHFAAAAREVPAKQRQLAVSRAIDHCGLHAVERQLIDTLSKGYRQRTCLAQSLIHDPKVLVLDEPTDGLDPNQKQDIQDMIRNMAQEKSILLSTHIMEEAEFMSDRILLLNHGQAIADGSVEDLRARLARQQKVILKLAHPSPEVESTLAALPSIRSIDQEIVSGTVTQFTLQITSQDSDSSAATKAIPEIAAQCHSKGWQVSEIKAHQASLRDIFITATSD